MFTLRVNPVASHQGFQHRGRLQPSGIEIGKDIGKLAVELCRFEAVFFQILQGDVRRVVFPKQIPEEIQEDTLAVFAFPDQHDGGFKPEVRHETPAEQFMDERDDIRVKRAGEIRVKRQARRCRVMCHRKLDGREDRGGMCQEVARLPVEPPVAQVNMLAVWWPLLSKPARHFDVA